MPKETTRNRLRFSTAPSTVSRPPDDCQNDQPIDILAEATREIQSGTEGDLGPSWTGSDRPDDGNLGHGLSCPKTPIDYGRELSCSKPSSHKPPPSSQPVGPAIGDTTGHHPPAPSSSWTRTPAMQAPPPAPQWDQPPWAWTNPHMMMPPNTGPGQMGAMPACFYNPWGIPQQWSPANF